MKHIKFCGILFFIVITMCLPHQVSASCAIKSIGNTSISSSVCSIDSNTIEGADIALTESSTTNTAVLTITNTAITINSNAGLIAGTINLAGSSTISVLQSNTFIKTGGIWIADADADGWASSITTLYAATASGRRRLGLMRSLVTADCNDTNDYRINNTCCPTGTYYVDADGDGYGAGAPISMCPASGYVANNSDCNDANASIKTIIASGGTISTVGGYKVHTFTSSGTFAISCGGATIEYLVVGGGGAGATAGGGGRGGQVRTGSIALTAGNHTVTVGLGGSPDAGSGGSSVFSSITSTGGTYPSGYGDVLTVPAGGTYSSINGISTLYGISGAGATAYGGGWNCGADNGGPYGGYGVTGVASTGGGGSAGDGKLNRDGDGWILVCPGWAGGSGIVIVRYLIP